MLDECMRLQQTTLFIRGATAPKSFQQGMRQGRKSCIGLDIFVEKYAWGRCSDPFEWWLDSRAYVLFIAGECSRV